MQDIIVWLIVGAAAGYMGLKLINRLRGKSSGCGSCGGCGSTQKGSDIPDLRPGKKKPNK
ncbi:MAG TPA: FeoB-associated Cys-rich membrane protein [Desulfobacterales bacterium]|nr:FeoB-associated Cys-rich membrane protein [Desulfobacterales bacterium]